jgi:hypothetical protein
LFGSSALSDGPEVEHGAHVLILHDPPQLRPEPHYTPPALTPLPLYRKPPPPTEPPEPRQPPETHDILWLPPTDEPYPPPNWREEDSFPNEPTKVRSTPPPKKRGFGFLLWSKISTRGKLPADQGAGVECGGERDGFRCGRARSSDGCGAGLTGCGGPAERRHPTGRERMSSPTLKTLQDPILLLPWVCFRRSGFPNPSFRPSSMAA